MESQNSGILVVDDSEMYRFALRAILEDAGYDVTEAPSVAGCRQLLADAPPTWHLVLLDLELGDGRGPELVPALRSAQPSAPIVLLTGADAPPADGVDGVLSKTLDPATLLDWVARFVPASRA